MNAKQHWLMQKVSSIAMIPLCVWFALLLTKLASMDHSNFIDWLSAPTNTYFAIALLPVMLVWKAFKMADEWMVKWNNPEADRQKVPYELLLVNVSTIGIHFLTGILLSIAYILSS